jgi:gas vesicle protein
MDHERQERDLQEVFDATQASYRAAIENTFALQEKTLEFARRLMEASAETLETQADNYRETLDTLTEESQKHREAMENLVKESTTIYESLLRSPFSHHHDHSKFEEATEAPEVQPGSYSEGSVSEK